MKKLIIAVSVFAVLSLLAPGLSIAEPTHPNEVGLYMTPDGYGATGTYEIGVPVDVHLVLTKPCDVENNDAPYNTINMFECMLNFNPIGNLFKMGDFFPEYCINIGDAWNIGMYNTSEVEHNITLLEEALGS